MRQNTKQHKARRFRDGRCEPHNLELIAEQPLLIRIGEKPYSVVMRTPGDEVHHAAGLCLGEGIIDSPDDLDNIGYDEHLEEDVVDVWLKPERREEIPDILNRTDYVSQTSCGICGKKMVEDLHQNLKPVESDFTIDANRITDCIAMLSENQKIHRHTRSAHAALILDGQLEKLAFAEDVGRHNALDKTIGKVLMERKLAAARILVLSSRISYELVQKAARGTLPLIIGYSRPTALAVEMAKGLNMTLVFPDRGSGLVILGNEHRIRTASGPDLCSP